MKSATGVTSLLRAAVRRVRASCARSVDVRPSLSWSWRKVTCVWVRVERDGDAAWEGRQRQHFIRKMRPYVLAGLINHLRLGVQQLVLARTNLCLVLLLQSFPQRLHERRRLRLPLPLLVHCSHHARALGLAQRVDLSLKVRD